MIMKNAFLFNYYVLMFCFAGFGCVSIASAQSGQIGELDDMMEILAELMPEEQLDQVDWSSFLERLFYYREHPLDLNTASAADIQNLGLLSPLVVLQILEYRKNAGGFMDARELQVIDGLDIHQAKVLSQFFTVRTTSALSSVSYDDLLERGSHEFFLRYGRQLQKPSGYQQNDPGRSRYLGSPDRLLLRYRYDWPNVLKVSVNMEKDAGEQFFAGAQRYGFDFYSFSAELHNTGKLKRFVIGDYVLQFGQGIGMWSGFSMGKGSILHGIARQGVGLKPHTSLDEINFLRGMSGVFYWGKLAITPFVSYRKRDGNVHQDSSGQAVVSSLATSGLYRTPSEVVGRHQVDQLTYGFNIEFQQQRWKWGSTSSHTAFNTQIVPQPLLRNKYQFSGSDLLHTSLYYQGNIRHVYLFGEGGLRPGYGLAVLNGALLSMHHHVSLALLHRYYQKDHHTAYGDAFGSASAVANENGMYVGLQYQPNRTISMVTYFDSFRFPWVKYRADGPSKGKDLLFQLIYSKSRQEELAFRFRYQEKEENIMIDGSEYILGQVQKAQFRVSYDSSWGDRWRVRNRLEVVHYRNELLSGQYGWMFYQDVFFKPLGSKLTANARVSVFRTKDYNTRIYAFENDVLYASSFPVYYGNGYRGYINLRWKISKSIDLWLRYAQFYYPEASSLGSGLDLISGQKRSEVKTQIRIKIP